MREIDWWAVFFMLPILAIFVAIVALFIGTIVVSFMEGNYAQGTSILLVVWSISSLFYFTSKGM